MNLRTAGARSDLNNEVEFARIPTWFNWIVAISAGVFFVVTLFVWFDLIATVWRKTHGDVAFFIILLAGLGLTFGVPFVTYAYGYAMAKAVEYNRSIDSIQLIGTLGVELGNKTFSDAMQLGVKAGQADLGNVIEARDVLNNDLTVEKARTQAEKDRANNLQMEVDDLRKQLKKQIINKGEGSKILTNVTGDSKMS